MPEAATLSGHVLGFDFGTRRIGVAVGQSTTCTASSLVTLRHKNSPPWAEIEALVSEWRPALFVVGLPLAQDGSETDMSRTARSFGAALKARHGIEVHYSDERLTSIAAESYFASLRAAGHARRKQSKDLDSLAARFILENWLQSGTNG